MKCFKCNQPATISTPQFKDICNKHFLEVIEKRVRKFTRTNKIFKSNQKILILNDSSKEFYVSDYLVKSITKSLNVKISYQKIKSRFNFKINKKHLSCNLIILPWNLEDEADEFLSRFIKPNFKFKSYPKKQTKLLKNLLDNEIKIFADLKHFRYNKKTNKTNRPLVKFLDNMEKSHQETKFSLLKTIEYLKKELG